MTRSLSRAGHAAASDARASSRDMWSVDATTAGAVRSCGAAPVLQHLQRACRLLEEGSNLLRLVPADHTLQDAQLQAGRKVMHSNTAQEALWSQCTCSSKGAVDRSCVGGLQPPDHELEACLRQPILVAIQIGEPRIVLRVHVILHQIVISISNST